MSKFRNNKKIYSFRRFEKLDGDIYTTYDLAWPVEAIECYANKVSDGLLDVLAETVLELLTVKEMTPRRIAPLLGVSDEVVDKIVGNLCKYEHPLYDEQHKCVTQSGLDYIEKKDADEFLDEKVFGYMFVSRIDGEVFPFFMEGKLPWPLRQEEILYLSYDAEEPNPLRVDRSDLLDRVNRSFHRYGRISKASKENERSFQDRQTIEFVQEELRDQSYNEAETLAEQEEEKSLRNARIKLLNTRPTEMYVRCRLCVSKAAPDKYIIESPFPGNDTSWYSECFHRMIANNEWIYVSDDDKTDLEHFCENLTTQFYIDFPEMQSKNFEQYVKAHFPKMLSCSISVNCMDKYREVFNYCILCHEHQVKKHVVITEAAKALELILNNYIARIRKEEIVRKYKDNIQTEREIDDLFDSFGIDGCSAKKSEKKKLDRFGRVNPRQSIISHFGGRFSGQSIVDKYFFLVVEASFNENSKFRRLLIDNGIDVIKYLDFVNGKRNKFGAHNDGTILVEISKDEFEQFCDYFKKCTRILLDYID